MNGGGSGGRRGDLKERFVCVLFNKPPQLFPPYNPFPRLDAALRRGMDASRVQTDGCREFTDGREGGHQVRGALQVITPPCFRARLARVSTDP